MNQATLKPNEFIIRVDETDDHLQFIIVNPHLIAGNSGEYDVDAFLALSVFLKDMAKKFTKLSTNKNQKRYEQNESDLECDTESPLPL